MQPTNRYLIGAMLDPLVAEFMSPAYCEGMLEVKIRMDEQQRMNCPPRAGFVCVVDPRVESGHYYRKHVKGEGINARPPSQLEKAVQRQNENPPRQGLSTLSKVAIAGLLGVGGLAGLGAIANSGRSPINEPTVPSTVPTAPSKASPAYTVAKQQALLKPRFRRMGSNNDVIDNGITTILPQDSPWQARRKRGQPTPPPSVQVASPPISNPNLNQPIPPWSPALHKSTRSQPAIAAPAIATPSPVIPVATPAASTTSPKATTVAPAIATPNPLGVKLTSHSALRDVYASNAVPDDARKPGYKTTSALNAHLKDLGVIKNNEEFSAMLDNGTLVDRGLLVQRSSNDGSLAGFGKDNTRSIRIPAFTPPETLVDETNALANNRQPPATRLPKIQNLKDAITEKLNDLNLTDAQRANLMTSRDNATIQIARATASISKAARSPVVPPSPLGTGLQNKVLETRASELAKKIHEAVNAGTGQPYLNALTKAPDVDKSLMSKKLKAVQKQIENPNTQEFLADYHNNVFIKGTKIPKMPTPKIENEDNVLNGDFVQARAKVEPAIAPPVPETLKQRVPNSHVKKGPIGTKEKVAEETRDKALKALDVIARAEEKKAEVPTKITKLATVEYKNAAEKANDKFHAEKAKELAATKAATEKAQAEAKIRVVPSTPNPLVEEKSLLKKAEDIKDQATTLQQQLKSKQISEKDYNKAIGDLRFPVIASGRDGEDGKFQSFESYLSKTNDAYKALDKEMKQLLGADNYRYGGGWTDKSMEVQALATATQDKMKIIERDTFTALGLKFSDQLKAEAKRIVPSTPNPLVDVKGKGSKKKDLDKQDPMEVFNLKYAEATPSDGWLKSPQGHYVKQVLEPKDYYPKSQDQKYFLTVDKDEKGWRIYGEDHSEDDIAEAFDGKKRWKSKEEAFDAAGKFGESFDKAVEAADNELVSKHAEEQLTPQERSQLALSEKLAKSRNALNSIISTDTNTEPFVIKEYLKEAGISIPRSAHDSETDRDKALREAYQSKDSVRLKSLAKKAIADQDEKAVDNQIMKNFVPVDSWIMAHAKNNPGVLPLDNYDVNKASKQLGISIDKDIPTPNRVSNLLAVVRDRYNNAKNLFSEDSIEQTAEKLKEIEKFSTRILWDDPSEVEKEIQQKFYPIAPVSAAIDRTKTSSQKTDQAARLLEKTKKTINDFQEQSSNLSNEGDNLDKQLKDLKSNVPTNRTKKRAVDYKDMGKMSKALDEESANGGNAIAITKQKGTKKQLDEMNDKINENYNKRSELQSRIKSLTKRAQQLDRAVYDTSQEKVVVKANAPHPSDILPKRKSPRKKTVKDSFTDTYSLAREKAKQQFLRRVA